MEEEIWRPGVVANPLLLELVSTYLDASPNYWAPLLDDTSGEEPAQLHEPPPPSSKPSHSIIKTSSTFIHKPSSTSIHWRDTMILKRKARKLRERAAKKSMAERAHRDRATTATAAGLADHAKTATTLVTDRMADALPRADGKTFECWGVKSTLFSRSKTKTFFSDERYSGDV